MKLNDRKLERKEDYEVFKILLRCLKESKFFHARRYKTKGLDKLIDDCYYSRTSHPHEPLFINIGYWPTDCGSILGSGIFQLLFTSMLFNRFPKEPILRDNFIAYFKGLMANPIEQFVGAEGEKKLLKSYHYEINEALKNSKKLSRQKDFKKAFDCLEAIINGLYEEIPF